MLKRLVFVYCLLLCGVISSSSQELKLKPETEEVLKRIDEARTIYPIEKRVDREAIAFLIEVGADEKFLIAINTWEIVPVADSFRKRGLPKEFAKQLAHKPYTDLLATLGEPEATSAELKNKIKKSITAKQHLHRLHRNKLETDYDESFSNFALVADPNIIRLTSYLINYYEKPSHVCGLLKSFPKGQASYETGGLFFLKKNSPQSMEVIFISIPPDPENPSLKSYSPLVAEKYLPVIGNMHTHPTSSATAQRYSGPSGLSTDWPAEVFHGRGDGMSFTLQIPTDFLSLGFENRTNPFQVDTVVTLVGPRSFNIDIFFRDVITHRGGTYSNIRTGTVLDLGVYKCQP